MPASIVKFIEIPAQIASEEEAATVDTTGEATGDSTTAIMASNFIMNGLLSGAMDQIWSVMNNLQITANIKLFKAKSPGNLNFFLEFFETVTQAKLMDTEELVTEYMYVPESESISINFQNAGYDSSLAILNASSFLINFALHFSLVLGFLLLPLMI